MKVSVVEYMNIDEAMEVEEGVGCSAEAQEDDPGACSRESSTGRQLAIARPKTDAWTAQRGKKGRTIQSATTSLYQGASAHLESIGRPEPALANEEPLELT